ncbi:MAG: nucleoside hydrolase [Actinobacteria bacterium]|nr:nucleoside hydrolase [Actinomycetota bacterium]
MTIPVIIDCDPGHDDAIALLLALASPELEIVGVTTVGGNAPLEMTTKNALKVLELAGRTEIPVAAGFARPLFRELQTAAHVHGESGLDGPVLAEPSIRPLPIDAIDFLAEKILSAETPITLVPVGPLTNIAALLNRYPEVEGRVERIVLMGGAINTGNFTPAAEFNIYVDPEAAHRVFHSGLDITMVGLEVTHQALLNRNHAEKLRGAGAIGKFVAELLDFFLVNHPRHFDGGVGAPIHDAVAVAHLIWPDLMTTIDAFVTVETQSELNRGRTVVDRWHVTSQAANVRVGIDLDGPRFANLLLNRLSSTKRP